jgi:hypothetical protein
MPQITRALIRKRSEHNEGVIVTLEELALHQEELESLNEVIGNSCRKLKILYLQNNIIPKMENLRYLRDLEYLNLALNNISKIEGLQNCEFLYKLDLTCNFVDLDELESSMDHLAEVRSLRDLFMMGNPCQSDWDLEKFKAYVIARLPQLSSLDGVEITRRCSPHKPHLSSINHQLLAIDMYPSRSFLTHCPSSPHARAHTHTRTQHADHRYAAPACPASRTLRPGRPCRVRSPV